MEAPRNWESRYLARDTSGKAVSCECQHSTKRLIYPDRALNLANEACTAEIVPNRQAGRDGGSDPIASCSSRLNPILMAFALLKLTFRSAAERRSTLIISRHIHVGQRDLAAAPGAVIVVSLQSHDRNPGLGTTMGASYKCFTSRHTLMTSLVAPNLEMQEAPIIWSPIVGFSQFTASPHSELAVLWGLESPRIQCCRLH